MTRRVAVGPLSLLAGCLLPVVGAFAVAALFVAAFFIVFWLRGRSQRHRDGL